MSSSTQSIPSKVAGEAVEVLRRRLDNIVQERRKGRRPLQSDGRSTLLEDKQYHHHSEWIESRKTRAERAAEIARTQALCEAIGLLTGKTTGQVWQEAEGTRPICRSCASKWLDSAGRCEVCGAEPSTQGSEAL